MAYTTMKKLTDQQLLEDIKEFFPNFKCTIQDLRTPTEEFVTNFYSCWLQEFEVEISNIAQIQFSQGEVIGTYPDSYSGTIPRFNLLRMLRAFDVVPDFGMLDIISPTPKRTLAVIRAFIEFYIWSDNYVCKLMEKRKDFNDRKDRLKHMLRASNDLTENYCNTLKAFGQMQAAKKQIEEEHSNLQKKCSELKAAKNIAKIQTAEKKEKFEEKELTLQKISKEVLQISNQIKELSNQVVDSPTTVLSDLESLRKRHEEMEELSKQKRDMVEARMQSQNKLLKDEEDQQLRATQLIELVSLIKQQRELLKTVQTTDKDMAVAQEVLRDLKATLLAQSSKRTNRQEKLQSCHLRWKTLQHQLTESVEAAIRELTEKKNEKNKIKDSLKEDNAVEEKMKSLLDRIKKHIEDFQADYDALNKQENEYLTILENDVCNHMEEVRKVVNKKYPREDQS